MWRLGLVISAGCTALLSTSATSAPARSTQHSDEPVEAGPRVRHPIHMTVSDAPADPWAGVRGDQPITFEDTTDQLKRWEVLPEKLACTAARDHCLPAISWFWVHEGERGPTRQAMVTAFTPSGPSFPDGARGHVDQDPYTAYRTVPATHANLIVGAIVACHPDPIPADTLAAFDRWMVGEIERVDWDLGFVFFKGGREPHYITSTRIAVLSYVPGGKVTILGDRKRDQLAVKRADVILPAD